MNCNDYKIIISGYIDGELTPAETDKICSHLEKCANCRKKMESLKEVKSLCGQIKIDPPAQEKKWGEFSDRLFSNLQSQKKKSNFERIVRYAATVLLFLGLSLFFFIAKFPSPGIADPSSYRLDIMPSIRARENLESINHKQIRISPNMPQINLDHIKGLSHARLSSKESDFLYANGFVVTSRQFPSFVALYKDNQKNNITSFVTMDTAISGLSHILSRLRVDLERELFLSKLKSFTNILREQLISLHSKVPPECKNASLKCLSFIKVASILLNCDEQWPAKIEEKIKNVVDKEVALIYNGRHNRTVGIQESPIFGYDIDYNKFKIRWDETQDDTLRRYYQAMEWYSRCVFRSSDTSETQSALMILMAAIAESADGITIWDEMNQLLTALYGESDDLHLQDYLKTAREIYGDVITPAVITDKTLLKQFCRHTDKEKLPRIRSEVGLKGGLRIFGGRYYDRDMILQQLCYPYVGDKADPRVIPSLLDIAVIMNQPKAIEIAQEKDFYRFIYYNNRVQNYQTVLQQQLDRTSRPWAQGGLVSGTWVYKSLMEIEGRGYPQFCRSEAWQSRKLTSILCGLANVENSKPTFSQSQQITENFNGVVDPYPEFFNRMLTTIRNLEKLLQMVGYPLDRPIAQEIVAYKNCLEGVVEVSKTMLSGETLSQEEQNKLGKFVLGWDDNYQEANINELSTLFHRNDTQVDYYLHAAIEPIREMWVLCPGPHNTSYITRGGILVLYEFSSSRKVFPEQWRKEEIWKAVKETRGIYEVAPWVKPYADRE